MGLIYKRLWNGFLVTTVEFLSIIYVINGMSKESCQNITLLLTIHPFDVFIHTYCLYIQNKDTRK